MSVLDSILTGVEGVVDTYDDWCVGVTADPEGAHKRKGTPADWHLWDARSEVAARAVLQYLLDRGMEDRSNGDILPSYLYIYKKEN